MFIFGLSIVIEIAIVFVAILMNAYVSFGVRGVGPWPEKGYDRICAITLEPIDPNINDLIHELMPPLNCLGVEVVQKPSMSMPPLGQLSIVKQILVLHCLFINVGVVVDHGCDPLH